MSLKISSQQSIFSTVVDKYVPDGFLDPMALDEQLEIMAKIDGLDGFGFNYPTYLNVAALPEDPSELLKKVKEYNLEIADVTIDTFTERRWKFGAFSTDVRKDCIKLVQDGMDFAAKVGSPMITLWPAHDGFDYPFTMGYMDEWNNMIDSFQQICDHNHNIGVAVEYKQHDPRQRLFVCNVGRMFVLSKHITAPNFKTVLDSGHALFSHESLAESLLLLNSNNLLGTIHLNDNYRNADPDMIFGTVAFWDNLEFFYYLKKIDYKGWMEIDTYAPRDDREKYAKLTVKLVRKYEELADRLMERQEELEGYMKGFHFADNMNLIMDIIF